MKETFMQLRIRSRRIAFWIAEVTLPASVVALACSNTITVPGSTGGSGGTASQNDSGGSDAGSATTGGRMSAAGGNGRGGSTVIVVEPNGGEGPEDGDDAGGSPGTGGEQGIDPDEACALATDTVEAIPAVLELVIDTSGSMTWPPGWAPTPDDDTPPPGATKWEITRDALEVAVDTLAPEVALGANFYPNVSGDDVGICLLNRVALPIAPLGAAGSSARGDWSSALADVVPIGGTPTEGAYLFGIEQLSSTQLDGSKFLLLITDGTPTCTLDCECTDDNLPVDSDPLIAEAASALEDGIRTFVIGSPGSEGTRGVLSALATAGGTAKENCSDDGPVYCHFDMTTEPDLANGLARALDQVAMSLRSCEYPIPEPPDDRTLDRDRVNVLYTPSSGETETVPRDPSATKCDEGWQYSDDGKSILLCGEACEAAKADVGARVEVLFGCETVSAEPR
ncbi:MAG TPA: vWA domain-containing protein [Polyangiaceae bacterium]